MLYARVENGVVLEIITVPEGQNVEDLYYYTIVETLHECDSTVRVGWLYADGAFSPPHVVPPTPVKHLNNAGLARFTGASPSMMLENIRMSGVTRISRGRYRVSHETPYPTDQYSVMPSVMNSDVCAIRVTTRTAAFLEVRTVDLSGAAVDPLEVMVKSERVVE